MLEATCAVPQYRHIVRCDNQGPGKRTAPQPWDKQSSPTVSRNLGGYNLAYNKVMVLQQSFDRKKPDHCQLNAGGPVNLFRRANVRLPSTAQSKHSEHDLALRPARSTLSICI